MRPPQRLSFGSSVLERWISATARAVSSTGALCPGRLSPDALRHETGCKYRGIHAEMRNDEFQFSLVSPLFRLRARGPPLLPLLRLQPAQTAKTETLDMHPESPLRHAFFLRPPLTRQEGFRPLLSGALVCYRLPLQRYHLRLLHYTVFYSFTQRVTAGEIPRMPPYAAVAARPHRPVAERRNDEYQFSKVSPEFRLRARGPPKLPE